MPAESIVLNGMTWDHARGFDPMVVTSEIFAEENPDVRIKWHKRSLQAFADRPLERMAEDYDLMVIDHPHAGEAAASDLLVDLAGVGRNVEITRLAEESAGASHETYAFDGGQWALAIDAATPVAAYRPDLLADIPTDWREVVELAAKGQVIWPVKPINALMGYYNALASVEQPFGTGGIGADPALGAEMLEEMKQVSRHIPVACFEMDPIDAFEWLASRSSHAYVPYLYGYSNYARAGFRPNLVRVADIPAHGDNGPIGSPIGGTGIAVSNRTRHRDVAIDYAFWIASAPCQRGPYFVSGGQPGNVKAWRDPACNAAANNFFADTIATLERSYLRPRHRGYMAFQDEGGDLVWQCLRGGLSPQEASVKINAAYDRSFSQ
ncbi:MAG: extracellular solute-binding protein [Hyphomicrobiales bacterium]|nr:extracellular solute-binding protein [Hyphomicrobiales bacterium]